MAYFAISLQVYEDGLERLGCGSARDRVRWVSAIW